MVWLVVYVVKIQTAPDAEMKAARIKNGVGHLAVVKIEV